MRSVLLIAAALSMAACGTSTSYKYTKPALELPQGKLDGLTPEELELEALVNKIVASPACGPLFGNLVPDAIVVFTDHPGLTYTAHADATSCKIERGTNGKTEYVLPVDKQNAEALWAMLEDGTISDEERYRVHYVTYMPGLNASFRMDALYREDVAKAIALPSVIHLTLLNPNGYEYRGSKEPRTATAMVENGVWKVVEGHQGTPGMKLEVTVPQVEEQLKIVYGQTGQSESERLQAFKTWLDSVTVKSAE